MEFVSTPGHPEDASNARNSLANLEIKCAEYCGCANESEQVGDGEREEKKDGSRHIAGNPKAKKKTKIKRSKTRQGSRASHRKEKEGTPTTPENQPPITDGVVVRRMDDIAFAQRMVVVLRRKGAENKKETNSRITANKRKTRNKNQTNA